MKRTLLASVVALALGLGANAAVEKVATVQLADKNTLVQAATTAGNLVGYPMLGMMATMGLADNPVNTLLGEFRDGENSFFIAYVDPDTVNFEASDPFPSAGYAFVYAPVKSKQDFLTSEEGREEKDGAIAVNDGFVVYSEDGKLAAIGSTVDFAKTALADVAAAKAPMEGDFVRVSLTKSGLKLYGKAMSEVVKHAESQGLSVKTVPSLLAILDASERGCLGLRISDAGLDCRCAITPQAGSDLAKLCAKPLEGDALAFATADSVYAVSGAEGTGIDFAKVIALYDGLVTAVKESGINTDWYKSTADGSVYKFSVDILAAVKYFMSEEGQKAAAAVDSDEFEKKMLALCNEDFYKISPDSKPYSCAVSFPGVDSKVTMSALFAKVLPEAAAKKPAIVEVVRYYSAIKALAPSLVALIPEEANASMLKAALATFPTDDDAATAAAVYREGDDIACSVRLSAQEIRGFAAIVNTGIAYFSMMEASLGCSCDEFVEEDDDDDDDDADDAAKDAE